MKFVHTFLDFFQKLIQTRSLLWKLAVNDFKARHAASFLGVTWAFLQPILLLVTMWFAFEVALGSGEQDGFPFILWFAPALLVWNFFSESMNSMTSSVRGYSYLVRKVNFRVSILPLVKMLSAFFIHLAMLAVVVALLFVYGRGLTPYVIQILYYLLCLFTLLLGFGWLLSSITLFAPDIISIVSICITMGFWASPIAWNPAFLSSQPLILKILQTVNPMYYIIEGYRDTFLGRMWFWERPWSLTLSFWCIALFVFFLGAYVFNRLRPQFADML